MYSSIISTFDSRNMSIMKLLEIDCCIGTAPVLQELDPGRTATHSPCTPKNQCCEAKII